MSVSPDHLSGPPCADRPACRQFADGLDACSTYDEAYNLLASGDCPQPYDRTPSTVYLWEDNRAFESIMVEGDRWYQIRGDSSDTVLRSDRYIRSLKEME
jgi:hypothetical protein